MKKTILFFALFLCSITLYAQLPVVKFYLTDGNTKQYNLSDISNFKFNNINNYTMNIFYQDTLLFNKFDTSLTALNMTLPKSEAIIIAIKMHLERFMV